MVAEGVQHYRCTCIRRHIVHPVRLCTIATRAEIDLGPTIESIFNILNIDSMVQLTLCGAYRVVLTMHGAVDNHQSNGVFTPEQDNDKTNVEPVQYNTIQ